MRYICVDHTVYILLFAVGTILIMFTYSYSAPIVGVMHMHVYSDVIDTNEHSQY